MNAQMFTRFLEEATARDTSTGAEGKIFGRSATVPADASTGWAKGAIYVQTDGGVGTTLYINEGTVASSDFNAK